MIQLYLFTLIKTIKSFEHMKDKILALLLAKFAGVRKDGLAQLAGVLALQATTDEEASGIVEKLTAEKVNSFVTDYRKEVDKEVSSSNKTYEDNLKKKFDFVEKKSDDDDPGKKSQKKDDDETPAWAKALIEQNKTLADKLAAFEGEKIKGTRLQQLEGKLKDVPETFKTQKLKDFGRMNFETDEAFNGYLAEVETDIAAFNQELANKGLAGHGKPAFGKAAADGVSAATTDFIASKTAKDNPLGGKEV